MRDITWEKIEEEEGYDTPKHSAFIQTGNGIIPAAESGLGNESIDFWICHTNFDVSADVLNGVERIEGVATLEPFSRYHFRIGVPKSGLFKTETVKNSIKNYLLHDMDLETVIGKYIDELYLNSECALNGSDDRLLYKLKDGLDNLYTNWAIYCLPNNEVVVYVSEQNSDDFLHKVDLIHNTQLLVGGKVYTKYGG